LLRLLRAVDVFEVAEADGLDFVACCISAAIALQSLRRPSSSMALMNWETLAPVFFVLSSATGGSYTSFPA
jgi:hypothetical protein